VPNLPVAIFSLSEVPVGSVVRRILTGFDSDPDLRYRVLAGVKPDGAYPMSREGVDEHFGQRKLSEMTSAVWPREMTAAYLDYLRLVMTRIHGKRERTILTLDEASDENSLDGIRVEWLRSASLRKALEALTKALEEAMSHFNIQMIAGWLQNNLRIYRHHGLLEGLEGEDAGEQLTLIANMGFHRGTMICQSVCARAFTQMTNSDAPARLRAIFIFTRQQLAEMAKARMGYGHLDVERFEALGATPGAEEAVEEDLPSYWRRMASGLLVPRERSPT